MLTSSIKHYRVFDTIEKAAVLFSAYEEHRPYAAAGTGADGGFKKAPFWEVIREA